MLLVEGTHFFLDGPNHDLLGLRDFGDVALPLHRLLILIDLT